MTMFSLLAGCSDDIVSSGLPESGLPESGVTQYQIKIALPRFHAEVLVAIVDDRPYAADFRTALVQGYSELEADYQARECPNPNPLEYRPIDRSLFVVHPSLPPENRYTGPVTDPGLRWQAESRTEEGNRTWTAHVAQALEAPRAAERQRFAPLEAFKSVTELLARQREPVNEEERALSAAAASTDVVPVALLVAAEDESTQDPASYAGVDEFNAWLLGSVVAPAAQPSANPTACGFGPWQPTTARLEKWLNHRPKQTWPCQAPEVLSMLSPSCAGRCAARRPKPRGDGSVNCKMSITTEASVGCNAERGRLDPLDSDGVRRPRSAIYDGLELRICDVLQLEGAALDSCRTSRACEGCTPGWCWHELPGFDNLCEDGKFAVRARLAGGVEREPGLATLTCDVD